MKEELNLDRSVKSNGGSDRSSNGSVVDNDEPLFPWSSSKPPTSSVFDEAIEELTSQIEMTKAESSIHSYNEGKDQSSSNIRSTSQGSSSPFPKTENMASSVDSMSSIFPIPLKSRTKTSIRSLSIAVDEIRINDASISDPTTGTVGENDKKKGDWKIPRFLRRTQSANEEQESFLSLLTSKTKSYAESSSSVSSSSKSNLNEPTPHCSKDLLEKDRDSKNKVKSSRVGTDMKFRLGFLKRRHTEGQIISPPSVRPSPEEAKKWAESFQSLMASKYGQCLFKAFLRREFSHENIEFWIAIEQYRKARERKLPAKAQKIINEFILNQAPREVNLDSTTRDCLISSTQNSQPTYNTFDQAQKRIQGILEADAYVRFLQSDLYLELIHPENYNNSTSPGTKSETKLNKITSLIHAKYEKESST